MNRFEFKIIKENDKVIIYENDFYQIKITKFGNDVFGYNVNNKVDGVPRIYIREDSNDKIEGVEIKTASYGGLDIKGIETMIEGYQIAIETVKEINKMFNLE